MLRSRHAALYFALALFATTACWDTTGICLHSEGCGAGNGSFDTRPPLTISGLVTSDSTGGPLANVVVGVDFPARAWAQMVLTDSAGRYTASGLPGPAAGDCAGLSVSFSKEGYQPRRVIDFPQLTCVTGLYQLNTSLTPTP
jgi:hypothetical protein